MKWRRFGFRGWSNTSCDEATGTIYVESDRGLAGELFKLLGEPLGWWR